MGSRSAVLGLPVRFREQMPLLLTDVRGKCDRWSEQHVQSAIAGANSGPMKVQKVSAQRKGGAGQGPADESWNFSLEPRKAMEGIKGGTTIQ